MESDAKKARRSEIFMDSYHQLCRSPVKMQEGLKVNCSGTRFQLGLVEFCAFWVAKSLETSGFDDSPD